MLRLEVRADRTNAHRLKQLLFFELMSLATQRRMEHDKSATSRQHHRRAVMHKVVTAWRSDAATTIRARQMESRSVAHYQRCIQACAFSKWVRVFRRRAKETLKRSIAERQGRRVFGGRYSVPLLMVPG